MLEKEKETIGLSKLVKNIFHLVPKTLFDKFFDKDGSYDCRFKKEWGNNSPFIHTSPTKKQLKEQVADINWSNYPVKEKFLLLKIDTKKINSRITHSIENNNIYHHIWGSLPKRSFVVEKVNRNKYGKFLFK